MRLYKTECTRVTNDVKMEIEEILDGKLLEITSNRIVVNLNPLPVTICEIYVNIRAIHIS